MKKKSLIFCGNALAIAVSMNMLCPQQTVAANPGIAVSPISQNNHNQSEPSRTIVGVENVNVSSPVGTVPRLPFRLWVTYSDGFSEYRQVRWSNSSASTEKTEADPAANPAGTKYEINGFIIGDNTTTAGYPV